MIFFSKQTSVILLLHRVNPLRDKMWDPMDPELFENILRYIHRKFHVISLNELLFYPPEKSSKPFAAITFDDGYHDFLDYSFPILKRFNFHSTLFVVTDCIENNTPTWTYLVDYLFENSCKLQLSDFKFPDLPSEFKNGKWLNRDARMNYGKRFKQYLKWIPSVARKAIINSLIDNFNDVKNPDGMMLSWKELGEIKAAGIEIGSHSTTHSTLASIENENELKQELEVSAKILKEKLGTISPVFSYPCGSYNEHVKTFTQNAGYKAGLAVNGRLYNSSKEDLFEVPRIELYNQSWIKTKMRINGTMSFIEKTLKR
ncbi:MAG: polysaccharide deacetylase family protein [Ginsengibacter sp.]